MNRVKPVKVLEQEKRDEGLGKALGADNKGFAMLQKMGFKPGTALGKAKEGRTEPIAVEVKTGRGGLGEAQARKRQAQEMAAMRAAMYQKRQKHAETQHRDFRSEKSKQMMEKRLAKDLLDSQRVCQSLDLESGITEPDHGFYWTVAALKDMEDRAAKAREGETDGEGEEYWSEVVDSDNSDEDTEPEEGQSVSEQLSLLTEYLRSHYLYCVWCGTRFESKDDLADSCPGDTSQDHDDV